LAAISISLPVGLTAMHHGTPSRMTAPPKITYIAGSRSATIDGISGLTDESTEKTAMNEKGYRPRDLDHSDAQSAALVDSFARPITYLRVSVTDRCDFRCVYCMSEHMSFLPKSDLLSLEELDRVCSAFVSRGVRFGSRRGFDRRGRQVPRHDRALARDAQGVQSLGQNLGRASQNCYQQMLLSPGGIRHGFLLGGE
jgi:hypothetical protein